MCSLVLEMPKKEEGREKGYAEFLKEGVTHMNRQNGRCCLGDTKGLSHGPRIVYCKSTCSDRRFPAS
jgi:hypothetical protein